MITMVGENTQRLTLGLVGTGYYPSERDVVNMIDEVKYKDFTTTGELAESINYEDLLKLYINHRCAESV